MKNSMKKIIFLLLSACILFTGCAGNTPTSSEAGNISSEKTENKKSCKEIAEFILSSVDFPAMGEITEEGLLETVADFKSDFIKEFSVYQQLMSVHLYEIIIVRADDKTKTLEMLENRKKTLIETLAFYPEQMESANATVVGATGDICYLITHEDASQAEKKLLEFMK